ncbi:craniofacial development protein 2-like [Centruroides sculpturatus]|uniref:craniofacial development protein 2-like n=1 Tax=Centruroides sculpturatus TaxID=218467 RepID=UPI000C6CD730|nr:craniofacial development protein 2-like [Centruroides sculpturatus]
MEKFKNKTTPGGNPKGKSTVVIGNATGPEDSGEPKTPCKNKLEHIKNPKIKPKVTYFFGTLNVNSMLKVGKLKQLNQMLREENILILAIQETRFIDINTTDSENYRYFKGKPGKRIMRNTPHLGTAFCVHRTIVNSITKFQSPSGRLSLLTFKCANKSYTLINCHAPINEDNRKNPTKVEQFWEQLEDEISKIPRENVKILVGDFNAQIGKEKSVRNIVGKYPAHKRTNQNGLRLIELCKAFNLKLMSTNFKKLPRKQKTWRSPNPELGEFQIDHVAISKQNQKEILNVKIKKEQNFRKSLPDSDK